MPYSEPNSSALTPTAIFGGMFNPPHFGHLHPLQDALNLLSLDKLALMPCHIPPHKVTPEVSTEHRLAMLALLCAEDSRFCIEDIEIRSNKTSYTVETLKQLRKRTQSPLWLFMGTDSFNSLRSWHEWQSLIQLCNIFVLKRGSEALMHFPEISGYMDCSAKNPLNEAQLLSLHTQTGKVVALETKLLNVSSTQIRNEIRTRNESEAKISEALLPESVLNYIHKHHLYES
jgi:nicotinate-nucleotide adenylyltransferase